MTARHRFPWSRTELRAMLTAAEKRASRDGAYIDAAWRADLRYYQAGQKGGEQVADLAGQLATARQEIARLCEEKANAWAERANAHKQHVPAVGTDPQSAFYSGEDTAENPLPPDPSPGDWVNTGLDNWRGARNADSDDTAPADTLATPGPDHIDTTETRAVVVPHHGPAGPTNTAA